MADKIVEIKTSQNKITKEIVDKAIEKRPMTPQEQDAIIRRLVELHKDQM